MNEFEIKNRCLLIQTTIDILRASSKHSGADLSNIINEWKEILEELNNDLLGEKDE